MAPLLRPSRLLEAAASCSGVLVVGVDDCGRGAIAGPIFAAAARLPAAWEPQKALVFGDAKALSVAERTIALRELERAGAVWATAAVAPSRVDFLGHRRATEAAMALAAERLLRRLRRVGTEPVDRLPCHCLVDGDAVPEGKWSGEAVPQGDARESCIAAASIAARVARDASMASLARRWPQYEWLENGGHASAQHLSAIIAVGPCDVHRASCFPFMRSSGRRAGYHVHRNAELQVHRWLNRAADLEKQSLNGVAYSDGEDDEQRGRLHRYLAMHTRLKSARRLPALQADKPTGGGIAGRMVWEQPEAKRQRRRTRARRRHEGR